MEIAPNIHRIACTFGGTRVSFVHLFVGKEAVMLVDTCCAHNPAQDIIPYMERIGVPLERLTYILISHSDLDHQGGNQPMKEAAPQAIIMCHNLDRPWVESTDALINGRYKQFDENHGFVTSDEAVADIHKDTLSRPMDMTLEGGETFRLSADWHVEAVHTPGHTWGHLAVFDPKSRTMAAGEAALWNAILDVDFNPVLPPTYCYVDTYLATLERLIGMQIDVYSGAHWPLKRGAEVDEFLRESRNFCLHVESRLMALAREAGTFTLREAIQALAPEVATWEPGGNGLMTYPLAGNLHRLTQRNQLVLGRNNDNLITWSLPA